MTDRTKAPVFQIAHLAKRNDAALRAILGHALRDHVAYQSGKHSEAPALVFADADYEVEDGTCGLWSDGKQANEPAIVYARFDAVLALTAKCDELRAENIRVQAIISDIANTEWLEDEPEGRDQLPEEWCRYIEELEAFANHHIETACAALKREGE